jgi:hypothetical protein
VHFGLKLCHASPDRATGDEDQQINREVTEDEQRDSASRQYASSERYNAHHACERRFVYVVGYFERRI